MKNLRDILFWFIVLYDSKNKKDKWTPETALLRNGDLDFRG